MIRKSTNDLSIKPKVSAQVKAAVIAALVVLVAGSLYFAYTSGVKSGHEQYSQDQALIGQLSKTIDGLRAEMAENSQGLIFAQRQQQIQEEAYKQISNAYANSEQKNRELGSRLDFYRSIISPEDAQSGPAIQSLESSVGDTAVNFDVTLVQAIKHKHQVRGNVRVTLFEGESASGQWPVSSARSVSYQYFEKISGSIETSSVTVNNNKPRKLKVELALQDGNVLERWFEVSQKPAPAQ